MTVVLEDQVKSIADEIIEQFGRVHPDRPFAGLYCGDEIAVEDVVRAVIALYDISNIARLHVEIEDMKRAVSEATS
jgi:hypothetical protein